MSDTSNYFGPVVNMHGGQGNVGINHGNAGGAASDAELRAAVAQLIRLLQELHPHLPADQARTVDGALPELTPDRDVLRQRGTLLDSLERIAVAVGAVGQPTVEAVGRLLALLAQ